MWARRVTPAGVRDRADREVRKRRTLVVDAQSERHLSWWWTHEASILQIEGRLPAAEGAEFISAIDRLAKDIPEDPSATGPTEGASSTIDQKRADALSLLSSTRIANDQDPGRARIVMHAPSEAMSSQHARTNAVLAGGPAVDPRVAQRLACDGSVEVVLYHQGETVGVGRSTREPSRWLRRQVLFRQSHACGFPGCEMKRFLHVHHVRWWEWGGPTDLDNLLAVCPFHHKLLHEFGWSVTLHGDVPRWFRPSGRRYEPGPAPPVEEDPQGSPSLPAARAPWGQLWHLLESGDSAVTETVVLRYLLKMGSRQTAGGGSDLR